MKLNQKSIIGTCLGQCIHVGGILNFLAIAQNLDYQVQFLPPPIKLSEFIEAIKKSNAKIVVISYRLTPDIGKTLLHEFIEAIEKNNLKDRKFLFGGLPELVNFAYHLNFFDHLFLGGESTEEILPMLRISPIEPENALNSQVSYPRDLLSRIQSKKPFPILRAHFGLSSKEETNAGIRKLAENKVLDIISIAPDQAAQEFLHRPSDLQTVNAGAGGVPLRNRQDLIDLYESSFTGNYPLLRIYSGTQDLLKNAQLFHETIHNTWPAIPVFWYSELDGRSQRPLYDAITENLDTIRWYVEQNWPVEINDPHQWGLRRASDALVVADAYLCAKIAKELGVKHFIQQLMFNTPSGVSLKMDFARILAMIEITKPLIDVDFKIIRETRAGLAYFSSNIDNAKGQLCLSTAIQMAVQPDIIHIVSFCEGDHAANADDIIESCRLVRRVIEDSFQNFNGLLYDPEIERRKTWLVNQANVILNVIPNIARALNLPLNYSDPSLLSELVKSGLFDAPQLKNSKIAKGDAQTRIINGANEIIDSDGCVLTESERISRLFSSISSNYIKTDPIRDQSEVNKYESI